LAAEYTTVVGVLGTAPNRTRQHPIKKLEQVAPVEKIRTAEDTVINRDE
jgi:hypothetical protein